MSPSVGRRLLFCLAVPPAPGRAVARAAVFVGWGDADGQKLCATTGVPVVVFWGEGGSHRPRPCGQRKLPREQGPVEQLGVLVTLSR
jgi:hypothetical protein